MLQYITRMSFNNFIRTPLYTKQFSSTYFAQLLINVQYLYSLTLRTILHFLLFLNLSLINQVNSQNKLNNFFLLQKIFLLVDQAFKAGGTFSELTWLRSECFAVRLIISIRSESSIEFNLASNWLKSSALTVKLNCFEIKRISCSSLTKGLQTLYSSKGVRWKTNWRLSPQLGQWEEWKREYYWPVSLPCPCTRAFSVSNSAVSCS